MENISKSLNAVLDKFMKLVNTKTMVAIKDGFLLTMPVTLIGSIFLLVANFPIPNWDAMMAGVFGTNWAAGLNQVSGATFDILAIVTVLSISYVYAKNEKVDAMTTSILSLVSFLILTDSFTLTETGEKIAGVIPKGWTAGNGVITAIFVAIIVGKVFAFFVKRKITIKMPDSVPPGVTNAFSALIPGAVVMFGSMIVYTLTNAFFNVSLTELIFKVLQTPLQNLSDTLPGGIIMTLIMAILFWAGIHGPNIVMGIMSPILTANAMANQEVLNSGAALVVGENAKIMTVQLIDVYAKFGGQGITIGLLIGAILIGKSSRLKEISKLSLVSGLFNINEPVIYGLPIVFNPIMLVPFIVVPVTAVIITYMAIRIGFMAPFTSVQVPWTTPPIISGWLTGGWQGAVVQIIIIIMSIVIYLPFVKKLDAQYVQEELETSSEATE